MTDVANEINLAYVTITYQAPIVIFKYKKGAQLGFPEIREVISCAEKLSGNKPYVTLAYSDDGVDVTDQGKKLLADPKNTMPLFRGSAVVVSNSILKFAVDFMNSFNRPQFPFRAFVSEEKAMQWLRSLPL